MSYTLIFFEYLAWHYGAGIKEFLKAWGNIHWFWYHFFSMPVLLKTLFKPFHRMGEGYGSGFNPQRFFEALIVNFMMRVVGIAARSAFLALGVLIQAVTLAVGAVLFVLFAASPVLVPVSLVFSLLLIAN